MRQPHTPIAVEKTFDEFIRSYGGQRVADLIPANPNFENADYLFLADNIVAELKEITTEFHLAEGHYQKLYEVFCDLERTNKMTWADVEAGRFPREFRVQQTRLFRPPIQRMLKKANRQIRATKDHLKLEAARGLILVVNDGFTSISPLWVKALIAESLVHSHKSIDAFVYLTVNTYVDLPSSEYANLIWTAAYNKSAPDSLVHFVDEIGRAWGKFLDTKIGPFDVSQETDNHDALIGSRVVKNWTARNDK